jgi:hypothetical protein
MMHIDLDELPDNAGFSASCDNPEGWAEGPTPQAALANLLALPPPAATEEALDGQG